MAKKRKPVKTLDPPTLQQLLDLQISAGETKAYKASVLVTATAAVVTAQDAAQDAFADYEQAVNDYDAAVIALQSAMVPIVQPP